MDNTYINWHYNIAYPQLVTVAKNLFIFPFFYFSIPLHTKTLFAPWKRQVVAKKKGFRLNDVMSVISFNLTSRFLGFMIRISFIASGLLLCILLPLFFLPVLIFWPFVPGISYFYYLRRPDPAKIKEQFLMDRIQDYPEHKDGEMEKALAWFEYLKGQNEEMILLSEKRIRALTGIGTEWAYGYTVTLDKYSHDLTKIPQPYPFLLGRDRELDEVERALLKSENNNVLIIGEPGIGRHILIATLAYNLSLGKCDPLLAHTRILQVDMHALFAATENHDKLKALFSDLLEEAVSAGNVNIYIDDIDKYVSTGDGRVDMTDVIEKFSQSHAGLIGLTTPDNFHSHIESNPSLSKVFAEIKLEEPSPELVLKELEISIVPVLEKKYPLIVTIKALEKVIQDCDKYLTSSPYPGKAVELLEESMIWKTENLTKEKKKYGRLIDSDIDAYLSGKLKMPLGEVAGGETEKLLNLEDYLHKNVINQHQAIRLIAASLRRSRLNISSSKKPVGSFLFLGPTGVGKTETAKALNKAYFGEKSELLRFDMSEFQGEEGLTRLIGSAKSHTAGELTSRLRDKPFGVVLFDEIEKSPPVILNLFLTLLDEGYITDALGKKVDCRNNIIIATSNAGAAFIRDCLVKGIPESDLSKKTVDYVLEKNLFSPEFINRFDSTVVYTPLNEGQLKEVAKLMLQNLNDRLVKKELSLEITPELVNHLASLGTNLEFGARSIRREIETNIEDQIAQKVLRGETVSNTPVTIDLPKVS